MIVIAGMFCDVYNWKATLYMKDRDAALYRKKKYTSTDVQKAEHGNPFENVWVRIKESDLYMGFQKSGF